MRISDCSSDVCSSDLLLVSHSMHAIRLLCPRALLFRQGRLELDGPSEEVIARHHELLSVDATAGTDESSGAGASLVERTLVDATGAVAHHPRQGDHPTYPPHLTFHHNIARTHVLFFRLV